jgi:outer membrane protein assembly factor BamA
LAARSVREVVLPRVVYRPVSQSKRVVFAGNAFLGLATGFPQQGILDPNTGQPDLSLPQSERFYAGGDTTNRGFAIDQLGVRYIPSQPEDTIDVNGFPLGGNAVVLFNAEVRVPTWRGVEVHTFLDTGNVFQNATNIDFGQFRPRSRLKRVTQSPNRTPLPGSIWDSSCILSWAKARRRFHHIQAGILM